MEILITESQLKVLLKEEYSEKVISQLLKKFIDYDSTADNQNKIIDHKLVYRVQTYIQLFDKIKNGPNITKKDIFTYTLPELEDVVLNYMKKDKPKSYKGDSALDLVYSKDNLLIYVGDTKEKCITYGNGYNFCISAHGNDNLYGDYRFNMKGTPYFIFNNNLEPSKNPDDADEKTFLDPNHLIVLFVYPITNLPDNAFEDFDEEGMEDVDYGKDMYYSITDANNKGEKHYLYFDSIVSLYPWLKGLEPLFKMVDLNYREGEISRIPRFYESEIRSINRKYENGINAEGCKTIPFRFREYEDLVNIGENGFFQSYKNKDYKTYSTVGPKLIFKNQEAYNIEYVNMKEFPSKMGAERYIDISMDNYNGNNKYMRLPNIPKEFMDILTDEKRYKVIECDWSDKFIKYMGEIYNLYQDMVHKKWELSQMEDE